MVQHHTHWVFQFDSIVYLGRRLKQNGKYMICVVEQKMEWAVILTVKSPKGICKYIIREY